MKNQPSWQVAGGSGVKQISRALLNGAKIEHAAAKWVFSEGVAKFGPGHEHLRCGLCAVISVAICLNASLTVGRVFG